MKIHRLVIVLLLAACSTGGQNHTARSGKDTPISRHKNKPSNVTKKPIQKLQAQKPQVQKPKPLAYPKPNKYCALTFDDGPHKNDYKILSILSQNNAKATFYYIGSKVPSHEALVRKVVASGNGLGSHSYSHKNLKNLSQQQQYDEIIKAQDILKPYGNIQTYRPAFGSSTPYERSVLKENNIREVRWNIDTNDWRAKSASSIVDRATRLGKRKYPIILMHSTSNKTVQALPYIIENLKRQGCSFITF